MTGGPGVAKQAVEQEDRGFLGDSFHLGAAGETWVIDSIRVWVARNVPAACPAKLGDQISKVTLYGALENPPVPGEPECNCHALVPVRSVPLEKGSDRSGAASVKITPAGAFWQIDFQDVRWSLPGDVNVLFALRATAAAAPGCTAAKEWSLSASPAEAGYRLRRFDKDLVPQGFAEPAAAPKWINIQVRAHRDQ
jgi:hypothetical protein